MPFFREASQVAATGTSFTCAKPTGVVAGDVLVAFHGASSGSLVGMGTPTGGSTWNLLSSAFLSPAGGKVWWKVAGGSEPSTYGFTHGGNGAVSIIAAGGAASSTPILDAISVTSTSSATVSTPSTTPNAANDFEIRAVLAFVSVSPLTWLPPAGFTERTDIRATGAVSTTTATRTLSSGGATGTHSFTPSLSVDNYLSFTVNIADIIPLTSGFTGWGMPI